MEELLLYGLPAALLLRRARPPRRELLPTQKGRMAVVCVLVGIVAQYLLQALSWLWVSLLALLPGQVAQSAVVMPRSIPEGLLAFGALALTPALAEEALFRGGVFPCLLKDFSRREAFVLTVSLFALMHGSLVGLPAHFGVSLLATALLVSYGHLGAAISFHLAYNSMALLYSLIPALRIWERTSWGVWIVGSLAAVAALAFWLTRVHERLQIDRPAEADRTVHRLALALTLLLTAAYMPELLTALGV